MADSSSAHDVVSDGGELRKLSELRVIDLKAELKRRSLDTSGNKSMLSERLKRRKRSTVVSDHVNQSSDSHSAFVIEEEGGDPDEIVVYLETASKKTPKRAAKGKKQESDGLEECSMEDDSGDGQDETDVNLDSLNEMDIMDMSVLDEAEIDNGIPADCEDYDADEILDTLSSDGKEDILQESVNENGNDQQGLLSSEVLEMEDGNMDSPEEELKFVVKEEPEEEETNEEIENETVAGSCISEPLKEVAREESVEEESVPLEASEEESGIVEQETEASTSDVEKSQEQEAENELKQEEDKEVNTQDDVSEGWKDTESSCAQAAGLSEQGSNGSECESETKVKAEGEEGVTKAEESTDEASAAKESSSVECDQKKSTEEESANKDEKALASSTAASSGRNLWVSGLSSTTRATDLKNLFSKYGKVVGAKVVTNAKSPGARCYGFVTMCSTEEVTKCISHLHRTELHGRMISVERAKNEPAGKKPVDKAEAKKAATERRLSSESKSEKSDPTKDKKAAGAEEDKDGKDSERTVVMDKSKGEPVISVKTKSKERSTKSRDRKSPSKEKKDILSFNQIIEQRERERQRQREREIREVERRRHSGERDRDSRSERERIRIFREKEERERLMRKRNWLEVEKQRLEADRMEREFLERERLRVEYERRREQERIHREREELRRQQDQLRYEQDRRPLKRPYDMDSRKDDWPDKRLCMDDRYGRSDFGRPERYHDFDHRDRSRYNEDMLMDRRDTSRGMMDRDGQFDRDRHGRDSRDNWGYDRRGLNPREGRDWDSRKMDGERGWQGDRGMPGQSHMVRGGMAGRGGYMPGSSQGMSSALNRQNQMMQGGGGMQGGAFGRRY